MQGRYRPKYMLWPVIGVASLTFAGCGVNNTGKTLAMVGQTAITQADVNRARASSQVIQGVRLDKTPEATKSQVTTLVQQQAVIAWALSHHVTTRSAAGAVARRLISKTVTPAVGGHAALTQRLTRNGITLSDFQSYVTNQVVLQDAFNRVTANVTPPSTAEAYKYYTQNSAFYVSPPEALIRDIRVKTKSDADGILAQLKHGANFAALAERDSQDRYKAQGGSRGWVQLGASPALPKAWLSTVMTLKPGQMSIVKGPLGYSIIEVQASRAGATIPFSAVEPAIKAQMVQSAKEKVFDTWAAGLMTHQKVRRFSVG